MSHLTTIEDSVLNTCYTPPTRPYSNKEIYSSHERFFRSLRIAHVFVLHPDCQHRYYVRENGVKYKAITGATDTPIGRCSVCWKLRQTPKTLKDSAYDFIDMYYENFPNLETPEYNYYSFQLERIFYIWLYQETFK